MKMKFLFVALTGLAFFLPSASAGAAEGCRIKEETLEKKLAIARAADNAWQAAGLERALAEVRRNCNDDRLMVKNDRKIQDKERKVREREEELTKARVKGDRKKIAKQEKKLREAQAELAEALANQAPMK